MTSSVTTAPRHVISYRRGEAEKPWQGPSGSESSELWAGSDLLSTRSMSPLRTRTPVSTAAPARLKTFMALSAQHRFFTSPHHHLPRCLEPP